MAPSTAHKAQTSTFRKRPVGLLALLLLATGLLSAVGCHNDHPYGEEKNIPKDLLKQEQAPPKRVGGKGRGLVMPGP